MPTTIRDDPYPGHNVQVVVTDISNNGKAVSGALSEISGLEVSIKAIPYRNGNEDITVRKVPRLKTYTNLTCRRGATGHVEFWNWIKDARHLVRQDALEQGEDEPGSTSVTVNGKAAARMGDSVRTCNDPTDADADASTITSGSGTVTIG
jgi:phage tail-like protein